MRGISLNRFLQFKQSDTTRPAIRPGDRVLQVFCDLVAASVRPGDLFGRLGGEEFACLLADTSVKHAPQTAERVRRQFEAMRVSGLAISPTVSVGVAMASEVGRSLPALLAIADRALYRANADGRNRVAPAPHRKNIGGDPGDYCRIERARAQC
jgi:diguanylate cyclase (GGDEF)-like protein